MDLARLTWSMVEALKKTDTFAEITTNNTKLNTDSTTVLSWVQSPAIKFKPYVKNKIVEVQNLLPSSCWGYLPSTKNKSADLLSKGCTRKELDIILKCPDILRIPESTWPKLPEPKKTDDYENELVIVRKVAVGNLTDPLMILEKYNSWKKLVRVTAYVFRFIHKLRKNHLPNEKEEMDYFNNLTKREMELAENYWLEHAQKSIDETERNFEKYTPFIDENGLKRISGRIQQSDIFDYDRKHPILLPYDSRVSKLILEEIHKRLHHPGHNRVLSESRDKFWVINGRRLAKGIWTQLYNL